MSRLFGVILRFFALLGVSTAASAQNAVILSGKEITLGGRSERRPESDQGSVGDSTLAAAATTDIAWRYLRRQSLD
jgi:hypothetical protein